MFDSQTYSTAFTFQAAKAPIVAFVSRNTLNLVKGYVKTFDSHIYLTRVTSPHKGETYRMQNL